jgi:UPF0755 protein
MNDSDPGFNPGLPSDFGVQAKAEAASTADQTAVPSPPDPSGGDGAPVPRRRNGCLKVFSILLAFGLLAAGAGVGGWLWIMHWGERPWGAPGQRHVSIKPGEHARRIATDLAQAGLISNERVFLAWLALSRNAGKMQAGDYALKTPIAPRAVVEALGHGVFERKLTIPEGWTARQIAQRLMAQRWIAREQDWLDLVARPLPEGVLGEAIPAGAEGFCFPDTYRLEAGTPPQAILNQMLVTLRRAWQGADPAPAHRGPKARGLTLFQVVTLASMIEREARVPEEMPHIAAVYLNRLAKGMKLQCCATVYHALGDGAAWDRPLTLADLKVDSPYNTYLHKGLPVGPIGNPSRAAIAAVLHPADSEDLFYVYAGGGHHVFSKTYKEHLAAVAAARKRNPGAFVEQQRPE